MRKNIKQIIESFRLGTWESFDTCSTNGKVLYSYAMPIARKTDTGIDLVHYESGPSRTTKSQIRAVEVSYPDANRVESIA